MAMLSKNNPSFVIDKSDELVRIQVTGKGQKKQFGQLAVQDFRQFASANETFQSGDPWHQVVADLVQAKNHSKKSSLTLEVRYQFVRGTKDLGSAYGPGYLHSTLGWSGRQGDANHWVCSHDNVYVVVEKEGDPEPRSALGLAMQKAAKKRTKLQAAFAPLQEQTDNERVSLLAATTEKYLEKMQTAVATITMDMMTERQDLVFNTEHEGLMQGLTATATGQIHYVGPGGLLRSESNKNVSLIVASARHWQKETAAANHIAQNGLTLTMAEMIKTMDMDDADNPYMKVFRDLTSNSEGHVVKAIPRPWCAKPDLYNVRLTVPSDHTTGMGQIFCLRPGTPCVLFDCDGTLTTGDEEVVKQFMLGVVSLDDIYDPMAQPGAASCCRLWAAKGYQCVYLSGRAGSHHQMSNNWLMSHGFPPGPVHLTRTRMPTLPIYSSVGVFKVDYMTELQEKGCEIYACYGNTETDIQAYENIGCPKERTFIAGPHGGKNGSIAIDYQTHNPTILTDHPDAKVPIPYVSLSWGPVFVGEDDTFDKKHARKRSWAIDSDNDSDEDEMPTDPTRKSCDGGPGEECSDHL